MKLYVVIFLVDSILDPIDIDIAWDIKGTLSFPIGTASSQRHPLFQEDLRHVKHLPELGEQESVSSFFDCSFFNVYTPFFWGALQDRISPGSRRDAAAARNHHRRHVCKDTDYLHLSRLISPL